MLGYREEPLSDEGYTLRLCNCCPYGYHIDLDFVRYCESIDKETSEPTGTIKGRRDRRRQRKSMEVLLGITPLTNFIESNKIAKEASYESKLKSPLLLNKEPVTRNQGSFYSAISDFEKTLQRSKCKLSPYLPDVTAVTENNKINNFDKSNDYFNKKSNGHISNEYGSLTPEAFKKIREQMVLSLERTKQLEKQISEIPQLRAQITALENEKRKLNLKIEENQKNINSFNNNKHSYSILEKYEKSRPITKDIGVNYVILTRDVGVGSNAIETRNASTLTNGIDMKWKKLEFIDSVYNIDDLINDYKTSKVQTANKDSQTLISSIHTKNANTQTIIDKYRTETSTQTDIDIRNLYKPPSPKTKDIGIQYQFKENDTKIPQKISLEKLDKLKTVACQSDFTISTKHTQTELKTSSKSTQHQLKHAEKATQNENVTQTKETSTFNLIVNDNKYSQTESAEEKTFKAPVTFVPSLCISTEEISNEKIKNESRKKTSSASSFKELEAAQDLEPERKFTRQDTYTQICSLPPDESETDDKKIVPSREFQGALKVLNDNFLKHQSKLNQNAIDVIQLEWFKISSVKLAKPLVVENYLDVLDNISQHLLEYIVNMTDSSGNTAMHYAVSHGNFDVVSILLDSKVCDINKPNKAGYTSVMLVSLADLQNQTHGKVIQRLFKLADVNIKAKQNGQTALMLAVSHGRLDMVKMLLEAGADINIQDDDGSTALMCAAEHGHLEIVKHFLSQPECDSTITDLDGSTALKIAMGAQHRPIGVLLYAHERMQTAQNGKAKKKSSSKSSSKSHLPVPKHSY